MVTCKQIAEMVGVSRQAAASVLNQAPVCLVSDEKRDRILQLARELHYVRNNAARTLARGKSGVIGILTGGLHAARVNIALIMLDRVLRQNGFLPVIIYTQSEYEHIAGGIRSLVQQNVEGLIVHNIPPVNRKDGIIGKLLESGLLNLVPTIITATSHDFNFNTVCTRYDDACRAIEERVAQRRFLHARAFFRDPVGDQHFESERVMRKLISEFDFDILPSATFLRQNILSPDRYQQDLLHNVREAMKEIRPGTLYLCETAMCAVQVCLSLLQQCGKIPEDSAVISFDNTSLCSFYSPGITAIEPDDDLFAQKAWELLQRVMKAPAMPPQHICVQAKLVLRETF